MAISRIFSIRNFVKKQLLKTNEEGIMALPNKGQIDLGEMVIRENLFRRGIDVNSITSDIQLDNILNTPIVKQTPPIKKPGEVIKVDFDQGRWKDMDPEKKAQGGRTGLSYLLAEDTNERMPMWLGGGLTAGKRTLAELLKYMSKGSSHGKSPSEMLRMINPKQFNEMLNRPEGIPSIAKEMIEKYTKEMKIDRAGMVEHLIGTGRRIKQADNRITSYVNEVKERFMKELNMSEEAAEKAAYKMATMLEQQLGKKVGPKITDQGLLEMENIQKNLATKDRPLNAEGGRIGYAGGSSTQEKLNQYLKDREKRDREEKRKKFEKDFEDWKKWQDTQGGTMDFAAEGGRIGFKIGGIDKARRAFLKAMGVGAAGVGAAKSGLFGLLKAGKPTIVKDVTSVPIKNIEGMPSWFKPLVNRVIKEGTEIPSGAERVIVHKTKLPNSKTDVYVEQQLDTGDVSVQIGIDKHGFADGKFGQPVRLEYKASEVIEPSTTGGGYMTKGGENVYPGMSKGAQQADQIPESKSMKTKEEFWVEEAEFTGGHPENVKFEESTFEKFGEHGSDFTEVEKFATGKVKKSKPTKKADDFASGGRVPLGKGKAVKGIASLSKKKKTLDVEEHGSALAAWARKNDPKGYAKIKKMVDDLNQKIELKRAKRKKGRKDHAAGGLAHMVGE